MKHLNKVSEKNFRNDHTTEVQTSPVGGVVRAGTVCPHNHKHVLEVRADVLRGEGKSPGFLEHDGDDVVPDMALPQQLEKVERKVFYTLEFSRTNEKQCF